MLHHLSVLGGPGTGVQKGPSPGHWKKAPHGVARWFMVTLQPTLSKREKKGFLGIILGLDFFIAPKIVPITLVVAVAMVVAIAMVIAAAPVSD